MKITNTNIEGLVIIEPKVFIDDRGYFFESWNSQSFKDNDINENFVQDNQSLSSKGVLRGLHFQNPPYAQSKLVRVIKGSVLDVAVDIRLNSPTYGHHFSVVLSEQNFKSFFIPKGFAHGFITLEDNTEVIYMVSQSYVPDAEGGIRWDDPEFNLNWPIKPTNISPKDAQWSFFEE